MRNIKKLANFNRHFAWREDVMLLFGDCTTIASESRYKAIKGKWIKTLTPKQMSQRLSRALAQVKAGNTYLKICWTKSGKLYVLYIEQKKLRNKYI